MVFAPLFLPRGLGIAAPAAGTMSRFVAAVAVSAYAERYAPRRVDQAPSMALPLYARVVIRMRKK